MPMTLYNEKTRSSVLRLSSSTYDRRESVLKSGTAIAYVVYSIHTGIRSNRGH